ncbi:MAG: hypothetical protein K5911_02000 [Eubacteriales bacterium]|nr:hypothetical protein [Eubacteriales bacterium]
MATKLKEKRAAVIIASVISVLAAFLAVCIYNWFFSHETDFQGLNLGMTVEDVQTVLGDDICRVTFEGDSPFPFSRDGITLFPDVCEYMLKEDFQILCYSGRMLLLFDCDGLLYGAFFHPENFICTPQCGNIIYDCLSEMYGEGSVGGGSTFVFSWKKGWETEFYYEKMRMEFTIRPEEFLVAVFRGSEDMYIILCDDENRKALVTEPDYREIVKALDALRP